MAGPFDDLPDEGAPANGGGPVYGPPAKPKDPLDAEAKRLEIESKGLSNEKARRDLAKPDAATNTNFDNTAKLRGEYNGLQPVKTYAEFMPVLSGAIRAPKNAQGDLAVLISFSKAMDPTTGVKEGETQMAMATGSQIAQAQAWIKKVNEGQRLPPEVRDQFIETMRQKGIAFRKGYQQSRDRYRQLAESNNFDPAQIIGDHVGDSYKSDEDSFTKFGDEQPAAAGAPPKPDFNDIQFGPEADKPKSPFSGEQQAAYDSWWKAHPQATAGQFQMFARSMGIQNGKQIYDAWKKGAGVRPGKSAIDLDVRDRIAAKMAANSGGGPAGVMGAVDTVTVGTGDEITAGGDAFLGAMRGEGSIGDLYSRNIDIERGYRGALEQENPGSYLTGQLVGGLALPAGSARTAGQFAKVGGAYGAAYGAGSAEGGIGDRLMGAAQGGVAGAAVGGTLGKVGDIMASRAAAKAAGREAPPLVDPVTGRMNEPLEALSPGGRVAAAEGYGIDLPMGAATDRGGAILEKGLDIMPGSAGVMNDARRITEGQVNNAVEREAGKFGDARTMFEAGTAAQSGAKAWVGRFEQVSGKAYDAIPISGKAPASVSETTATLKDIASAFDSNPALAQTLQSPRNASYLAALEKGGLSWQDLKAFRTRIGYEIGAERFSDSPTRNDLRRLYGALSEDMRNTAANAGPGATRAFNRANDLYAKGQQRIDGALKQILGDDAMKSPESAAAVIQKIAQSGKGSGNLKQLAQIRASTVKDGSWDEIASALIRQGGQAVGKEGAAFNPTTFVNWYSGMTEPARNLLFGGASAELRKSLDGFVAVNQRLAGTNALRNTSQSAPVIMGGGAVGAIATAIVNPLLAVKLAALGAANFGMGKAWTNPKFVRWATGYTKAIASKNPNAVNAQMGRLRTLGATNPQLREFVVSLEQRLLDAANDNATQRSVAEGQDGEVNPQP